MSGISPVGVVSANNGRRDLLCQLVVMIPFFGRAEPHQIRDDRMPGSVHIIGLTSEIARGWHDANNPRPGSFEGMERAIDSALELQPDAEILRRGLRPCLAASISDSFETNRRRDLARLDRHA